MYFAKSISFLGLLAVSDVLFMGNVVRAQNDCQGFKVGAEEHATVQYKEQNRRGVTKQEVTKAEIKWTPQAMLEDWSCYELETATLMYKSSNDDDWQPTEASQRSAGQSSKWSVDVKPCLEYQFQIRVMGKIETILDLPTVLGPASEEQIAESGFIPGPPSDLESVVGAYNAKLSWTPSDCGKKYDINFHEVGSDEYRYETIKENNLEIGDLKPCTNYEATLNALIGDDYSEDYVSNFATKPRLDAASEMAITVTPEMDSAVISWEAWKSVSCIDEYEVTICSVSSSQDECKTTEIVKKAPGVPTITHTALGLNPCTDYNLKITPLYTDTVIESKMVSFKTQSPPAATLQIGNLMADSVSSGSVYLKWDGVNCATSYKISRKASDESEWKEVESTDQDEITVSDITPCTQFQFAVSAVVDGLETEKAISDQIMSDLDENHPFEAPNLDIQNADREASLKWNHADCIESYVIKVCQSSYTDCTEETLIPDGEKTILHSVRNLEPCTQYSLEIIPAIPGKMFTARPSEFTTTNGVPQAPTEFSAELVDGKAVLNWEAIQCATGYKIYHKTNDNEGQESSTVTKNLSEEYEDLTPCQTYYYSVSTMVDGQESDKTEWQSLLIPPISELPPVLKIVHNEGDNITIRLEPSEINSMCQAAEYELSYSKNGNKPYKTKVISASDVPNRDILLAFKGASSETMIVQGRMRYEDTSVWSEVASSREPGDMSEMQHIPSQTSTMVPIIIGAIVAFVIILIIIVFIVKKRRNRNNYDAEKAENGKQSSDETRKLNDHPDA
ncbi:hypothetical protein TCAL_14959 [Tigriopus californicus]|uniref:Fibronectin type-III domain-containing protein n=1 Tax=Tigriopus californicus TaxID=6832 RepID=A0A553N6Y1_TIGCA|nr:uncharacterized protein LOC131885885 [Tigriopus californicus]XP_059090056.1 uncharacterized protein LOC131885885 [Tigriopus californicus]TRY61160.1 hypothetical protein TCAL_14959 [Tigriopus californicus]